MCGIVGAAAKRPIETVLIAGLQRLEYRGYDSAGIAVINEHRKIQRVRTQGKVKALENALTELDLHGNVGIAHTRWATHGEPSEKNAHPLMSAEDIALVHNGIIENHDALRKKLQLVGYRFTSETDTETIVHLLHHHLNHTEDLLSALQATISELMGAYALGVITSQYPDTLIAVRQGSPLVIGLGKEENFIASDPLALLPVAQQFIYLEDNDIAFITRDTIQIYADNGLVQRKIHTLTMTNDVSQRGEHRHYMSKEISEQAEAVGACLRDRITPDRVLTTAFGEEAEAVFKQVEHVHLVACGTSYHAAMVARYWLEELANIPCSVEVASEFRYRKVVVQPNTLFICLSQSGETADTLAALRLAKEIGFIKTLVICNVAESSLVREADLHFLTRAGIEIGVASTKAFTTQLVALLMLTVCIGQQHQLTAEMQKKIIAELDRVPAMISAVLQLDADIAKLAKGFIDKDHALFLGRNSLYPIALEGSLKLKEISYIHAEAYPAGELKHGPLALVDRNMPVIALAHSGNLFEKIKSNLHEVSARGGEVYVLTDRVDLPLQANMHLIPMPHVHALIAPLIYTIPLQLLAYHVAILKGTDVDQPRNLAKSVTVE